MTSTGAAIIGCVRILQRELTPVAEDEIAREMALLEKSSETTGLRVDVIAMMSLWCVVTSACQAMGVLPMLEGVKKVIETMQAQKRGDA